MPRSCRPATPDDIPFLVETITATTPPERWPAGLGREQARAGWADAAAAEIAGGVEHSTTCVLQRDGVDVGRLRVVRAPDRVELGGLQIRPEHQGLGLGTAVVLDLQAEATLAGLPFELGVEHTNPRARALYERLGMCEVDRDEQEARLRRPARRLVLGRDAEFHEPVLAALYDHTNTWGRDDQSFVDFLGERPGCRVLDLGCGTGRVTRALAAAGHAVTGIDPAAASLARARRRPGAGVATFVEGYADAAPTASFDAALMTAHVAQFVVDDEEWAQTLGHLHRALVPGGRLTFDTRDPRARAWEAWADAGPDWTVLEIEGRRVTVREWLQVREVDEATGVVDFTWHNAIGEDRELRSESRMRWRTERQLRESLRAAGFVVDAVHGGWDGGPPPHPDGELIVRGHRP